MIKAITGTKDILPSEIPNWNNLEDVVRNAMKAFNYKEIRTPIFEETRLFQSWHWGSDRYSWKRDVHIS